MASSPYSEWQAEAAMGARLMAGFDDQRHGLPSAIPKLLNGTTPVKIRHAIRRRFVALVRFWNFQIRGKAPARPSNGAITYLLDGSLLWCPPVKKEPEADEAP